MIRIDSKFNISRIEEAYNVLTNDPDIDIIISKGTSQIDFGLVPAIIQFICTWYSKSVTSKLVIDIIDKDELGEIYKLDFFFPAIVYCWQKIIVDRNNNDLKPYLRELNDEQHQIMKKQLPGGGPKVSLVCFDHLSIKKGLLNAFYIDDSFINDEIQFSYAIDRAVKKVLIFNRELTMNNIRPIYTDIIGIIYELMKNTNDWARTDRFNKPINPNTRGLYLKFHKKRRNTYLNGYEKHAGLKDFFSSNNFLTSDLDELYFIELSVYDSGVGFVQKFKPEILNYVNEYDQVNIIKQCLLKNNTSAVGIEKTKKGKGLDRIMKILDNKGFLWLRTSNVSIFRNFIQDRYIENDNYEEITLNDWFTNSSVDFSSLKSVKGSVITLVYPISNTTHA
ncbi:hypothetical protein [Spirosoma sp. KNUC1025]|uniref:hypothetical protein n=1 Tax=Spirosoma sp. KNUC1025 TaxID=2894082 RepID=UPI001E47FCD1|nr:hypothetical protein [Spirosoma sp. KNUC1025]UFH57574.1 hypothetical protein LN737_31200 [Spirosoma sp. KNUC1025]